MHLPQTESEHFRLRLLTTILTGRIDKRNVAAYNKEEKEKYDKVYENTFVQITDGELIKGLVVGVTKTDVVVNIGFKSDGLVSLNEFRDMPESEKW